MKYRTTKNKLGETISVPVVDAREDRNRANEMVKASNGNMSKYIPAKYSFGVNGPKKY